MALDYYAAIIERGKVFALEYEAEYFPHYGLPVIRANDHSDVIAGLESLLPGLSFNNSTAKEYDISGINAVIVQGFGRNTDYQLPSHKWIQGYHPDLSFDSASPRILTALRKDGILKGYNFDYYLND
ncbi:MAG: hypothetical protein ACMXYL_02180 [Candidatus Woesearchaeota archaeon]